MHGTEVAFRQAEYRRGGEGDEVRGGVARTLGKNANTSSLIGTALELLKLQVFVGVGEVALEFVGTIVVDAGASVVVT